MIKIENKNYKGLVWLVIILVILVLSLGGFIVCDKILGKNNKSDGNLQENVDVNVVDAVDYVDQYYNMFTIKLPKIDGNSKTIDELNEKILNDILPETYFAPICYTMMSEECMTKGSSVNYKYLIEDNIVVIYIYSSVPEDGLAAPATNGGLSDWGYYYDIENDKVLSISDTAEKLKIELYDETDEYGVATTYDELSDECDRIVIENDRLKLSRSGCLG